MEQISGTPSALKNKPLTYMYVLGVLFAGAGELGVRYMRTRWCQEHFIQFHQTLFYA